MAFDSEYFRRNYADYNLQNPGRKLRAYLGAIRKYVLHGRLLDVGCSYGLFVQKASSFFTCTGMDVNYEVVAKAARRVPSACFVTGALPNVPFRGFDVVTAIDVVEHVPDPESSLEAISDALRPGGIALVVVPVYDGPLGWVVRWLDRDPTHLCKCSRYYWLDLASRHFEVIEWRGFLRRLFFGKWYLHVQMCRFRTFAPAVALILRRKETRGKESHDDCCSAARL